MLADETRHIPRQVATVRSRKVIGGAFACPRSRWPYSCSRPRHPRRPSHRPHRVQLRTGCVWLCTAIRTPIAAGRW